MKLTVLIFLILTLAGPFWLLVSGQIDFHGDYRTADRSSAHLAPDPSTNKEAIIQVYSAPAFNWRKLFGVHTWIAVKPKDAPQFTIYQIVGWRIFRGLPALVTMEDLPDRKWFDETPKIILDLRGEKAETLIPKIAAAVASYPYPKQYDLWPGPNSNTFTAYVAREVPELGLAMPSNAVGKDYLPHYVLFARAPSGTGYQMSILGLFGIMLAYREGLEIEFMGLVYGISPSQLVLKLPGVGDVGLGGK